MAFMIPVCEFFSHAEAMQYLEDPGQQIAPYPSKAWCTGAKSGFYARLSAPGYLDATDWEGPFDREWKAIRYVCDLYGVDVRGEERGLL